MTQAIQELIKENNKLKKIIHVLKTRLKLSKTAYVCRFCGYTAHKPHGGKCPHSPHPNKCHEFIKA